MRKLIQSLAAAAAATAALSLIPLALVSSASASTVPGITAGNLISTTWAGRYAQAPNHDPIYGVSASWTAPKLDMKHSAGKPLYAMAQWVGIGGMPNIDTKGKVGLEQVGIAATAPSKTATPTYFGFYQMSSTHGNVLYTGWLTASGKKYTANGGVVMIKAGEKISATVYAPYDGPYTVKQYTLILSVNGTAYHVFQPLYKAFNKPGDTVEVVTELPGGPTNGLINTGATTFDAGYIWNAPKFGATGPDGLSGRGITMQNQKDLVILEKVSGWTRTPGTDMADRFTTTSTGRW